MVNLPLNFIGIEEAILPSSGTEAITWLVLVLITVWAVRPELGAGTAAVLGLASVLSYLIIGDLTMPVAIAFVAVGILFWLRSGRSLAERRHRDFLVQLAIVLAVYILYELVRMNAQAEFPVARDNAHRVVDFEGAIGLFREREFQSLFIGNQSVLRVLAFIYSYTFLAVTVAALLWLYAVDDRNYRLLRNSLGVSVVLASVTIVLFPVAPPRLLPEFGIVDAVVSLGREHRFANEYAAVPSLHVGWMVLVGFVVGRSIGGKAGWGLMPLPGLIMGFTVVVSGNHWFIDGVIGSLYTMIPAGLMLGMPPAGHLRRAGYRVRTAMGRAAPATAHAYETLAPNPKAKFSILALTALITYMLVARAIDAGFTDYWGYLVFQMSVTLLVLLSAEVVFAGQGGLSWQTHIIAVACSYADTLGTDGNLYAHIDEYDKLTHFVGVAAVTSGAYDVFRSLNQQRRKSWLVQDRLLAAVAVGVAVGVGWEVWELLGDKVFQTSRIGGTWDTSNDLLSDTAGALIAGLALWRVELRALAAEPASGAGGRSPT
jgi:uncharacterized membrane protein YjdF